MIKFSLFGSIRSKTPDETVLPWAELSGILTEFAERGTKEGPLWSPVTFGGGARKKENVDWVYALVLDFDGGHDPADFLELFSGYQYVIHSSFSSTPEHPKWRAVFPLAEPVPGCDWPGYWKGLDERFGGGVSDAACKDASRMYYLPAHPVGTVPFTYVGSGEFLDARPFFMPEAKPERPDPRSVAPGDGGLMPGEDFEGRADWSEALPGWTHVRRSGSLDYWRRPGKKEGISATTGPRDIGDRLICFSSSTALEANKAYTKFGAYAVLEFGGDYASAAKSLVKRGFGNGASESRRKMQNEPANSNLARAGEPARILQNNIAYIHGVEPKASEFNPGISLALAGSRNSDALVLNRIKLFAKHFGEWQGLSADFVALLKVDDGNNGKYLWQTIARLEPQLMRIQVKIDRAKIRSGEHRDRHGVTLTRTSRPSIECKNRQLDDLGDDLFALLLEQNDPETYFSRTGMIVAPGFDENGMISIVPVMGNRLRAELSRKSDFIESTPTKEGLKIKQVFPPKEAVDYLESLFPWPGLPPLKSIASCPVVTSSGVRRSAGYDWDQKVYVNLPSDVPVWDGGDPVKFIFDELLCDFPFDSDASRANTLAIMMLPILRPVIDGPTPLHLIEAPTQGTGKSLLAKVALLSTLGQCGAMTVPKDEDSWSKKITSALVKGSPVVFIDNIAHKLDSESLAAVLTTTSWTDRILGQTSNVDVPNAAVWIATSNNCKMSQDIARRTVYIRLDSEMEHPEERDGFKIPDIVEFATENRLRILSALTEIAEVWIRAGRPLGREKMGSFESWAKIVGGCMAANGVPGFLSNREQLQSSANDERDIWEAVFAHCFERYLDFPQSTSVIYDDLKETDFLSELGLVKTDEANKRSLAMMLTSKVGKIYGATKLEKSTRAGGSRRFKFTGVGATKDTNHSFSSNARAGAYIQEENQNSPNSSDYFHTPEAGNTALSGVSGTSQVQNGGATNGATSEIVEEVW